MGIGHVMNEAVGAARRVLPTGSQVIEVVDRGIQVVGRASVHRLTTMMLIVSLGVGLGVPQIRTILFALPEDAVGGLLVALSVVIAALIYTPAWFCALPIDDVAAVDPSLAGDGSSFIVRMHRRAQPLGALIDRGLHYCDRNLWLTFGAFVVALIAFFLGRDRTPLVAHAALLCGWLFLQSLIDKRALFDSRGFLSRLDAAAVAPGTRLVGRTVTLLLVTHALVEVVWGLQNLLGDRYGIYSRWAVFQALFVITMSVRAIDVLGLLGLLGPSWLRFLLAAGLAVLAVTWESGAEIRSAASGAPAETSARLGVRLGLTGRALARADAAGPSWLESFVARLETIPSDQPAVLVAASGGGSRAAITAALVYETLARTAATDERRSDRTLAQNVLLVSSVSGGSLATAYFVTHSATGERDPRKSTFVTKMSMDFMAPLLRGALTLGLERGEAVSQFWRDTFQWRDEFDTKAHSSKRPLIVLNATAVQTGERVGLGFPALPPGILAPDHVAAELAQGLPIHLADAVRISANFPYGFEHVKLGERAHELIDGGVVDNTGLDTLVLLLDGLTRAATQGAEPERTLAARAREGLRDRGLLVVEIDAGARPGKPSTLAQRFPSVTKPLEAFGRAGHRNSAALRTQNLERLKAAIDPPFVGLVRAGPDCDPEGDVMTAWALDEAARAKIFDAFAASEKRLTRALELQQASIRRMHGLRRHVLAGHRRAGELATTLNGMHQDYQERASRHAFEQHLCAPHEHEQDGTDPEQHARQHAEGVSTANAELAAAEAALEGVLRSSDTWATRQGGLVRMSSKDEEMQAPPDPGASAESADREALGWVYLGARFGQRWQTRYATWKGTREPRRGERIKLIGSSNLRAAMPDAEGVLGKARMALPVSAELEVLEVRRWGDSFVWARVAAPRAASADSSGSAPASPHPAAAE